MQPINAPSKVRGKFFKGDNGLDYVEITIIGDPNSIIKKVEPEHVMRFPHDWKAYSEGAKQIDVGGTPLTEVPGIDNNVALAWKLKGVRNAEELAALDEAAARSFGMGGITTWKAANNLVKLRQLEAMQDAPRRQPRTAKPPEAEAAA